MPDEFNNQDDMHLGLQQDVDRGIDSISQALERGTAKLLEYNQGLSEGALAGKRFSTSINVVSASGENVGISINNAANGVQKLTRSIQLPVIQIRDAATEYEKLVQQVTRTQERASNIKQIKLKLAEDQTLDPEQFSQAVAKIKAASEKYESDKAQRLAKSEQQQRDYDQRMTSEARDNAEQAIQIRNKNTADAEKQIADEAKRLAKSEEQKRAYDQRMTSEARDNAEQAIQIRNRIAAETAKAQQDLVNGQQQIHQSLGQLSQVSQNQRFADLGFQPPGGGGRPPRGPTAPEGAGGGDANLRRLGDTFDEMGSRGSRAANTIYLSWQTIFRLFQFQALHTALRSFASDIEQSISTLTQFQIKISEIRTISQSSGQSFEQWSKQARDLSDAFGNPILDVTAGIYETISNQIAKGAEATTFLTTAQKFAATTSSTLEQSVNLLSSALNSYHLRSNEAEEVAAKFFKTIDLGRVRAEEIANTIGRTTALAASLGVSMDEVNAAIATLTINGVPANESLVLINNIITHLIKPTQDMKLALQEMGVETGEQAIQIYGLFGALQQLDKVTRGSSTELASLFRDIRAIRGASGLTGISSADFQKNLEVIRNSLPEYQRAVTIAFESPGKELQLQLNRIHNYVIHDFAEPVVNEIASISKSFSDEGLLGIFKNVIAYASTALEIFIAYRGARLLVSTSDATQNELIARNVQARTLENLAMENTVGAQANIARAAVLEISIREREAEVTVLNTEAQNALTEALFRRHLAEEALTEAEVHELAGEEALMGASIQRSEALIAESDALVANAVATSDRSTAIGREITLDEARVAAIDANIVALETEAVTMTETAATMTGIGAVLRDRFVGFGASILSFVTSPVFLISAAAVAIYKIVDAYDTMATEAEQAFGKAVLAQQEANRKIIESSEKLQSEQHKIFEDSLNKTYASYTAFASKVIDTLEATAQGEKEQLLEVSELRRKALTDYVREYDDATNQITELSKRAADEAQRTQNDIANNQEKFREANFRREMQIAEHLDNLNAPGKSKGFAGNQIDLLLQEQDRLNKEREHLLTSNILTPDLKVTDPKILEEDRTRAQRLFSQEEANYNDILTQRLKIEDELKHTKDEYAKVLDRIAGHEANVKDQDTIREDTSGINRLKSQRTQSPAIQNLLQDRNQTKLAEQDRHGAEQIKQDQEQKKLLEDRIQLLETSQAKLPAVADIQTRLLNLQEQQNKLLNEYYQKLIEIKDLEAYEADTRKSDFESLRATISEITKFKFEKPEIKSETDLNNQIDKYDKLIQAVVSYGLTDQNMLTRLYDEEAQMRKAGNARILELQKKADLERLNQIKATASQQRTETEKQLKEQNETTLKALETPKALIETQLAEPTALGELNRQLPVDQRQAYTDSLQGLRRDFANVQSQIDSAVKEGGTVNPGQLDQFGKAIDAFQKSLTIPAYTTGLETNPIQHPAQDLTNTVIRKGSIDEKGNVTPDITYGSTIQQLRQSVIALQATIETRDPLIAKIKESKDAFEATTSQIAIFKDATADLSTSFQDLAAQTTNLIKSFKDLLPYGPPNPNAGALEPGQQGPVSPFVTKETEASYAPSATPEQVRALNQVNNTTNRTTTAASPLVWKLPKADYNFVQETNQKLQGYQGEDSLNDIFEGDTKAEQEYSDLVKKWNDIINYGGSVEPYWYGGRIQPNNTEQKPMYYAAGGPVGGDNRLIWAADGEYVVNKASTAKFLPQLEQINKYGYVTNNTVQNKGSSDNHIVNNTNHYWTGGMVENHKVINNLSHYAEGGIVNNEWQNVKYMSEAFTPVMTTNRVESTTQYTQGGTNLTFGDVNINVTGGGSEKQSAQMIYRELERVVRREGSGLIRNRHD